MMASLIESTRRLSALRRLPEGWDYGVGGPISVKAHRNGALLIRLLSQLGAESFDVVPGDGGGVVIVAYLANKSAEIHCLKNGTFELLHEDEGGDEQFREGLSLAELFIALEGYGWRSPRFFASCTRNAMFRESDGTRGSHLEIRPEVVYLSSAPIASIKPGEARVSTYACSTTKKSVESRLSSGEYRSLPFLEAVA